MPAWAAYHYKERNKEWFGGIVSRSSPARMCRRKRPQGAQSHAERRVRPNATRTVWGLGEPQQASRNIPKGYSGSLLAYVIETKFLKEHLLMLGELYMGTFLFSNFVISAVTSINSYKSKIPIAYICFRDLE